MTHHESSAPQLRGPLGQEQAGSSRCLTQRAWQGESPGEEREGRCGHRARKELAPGSRHQRNKGAAFISTGRPDAVKVVGVGGYQRRMHEPHLHTPSACPAPHTPLQTAGGKGRVKREK